jgi:hypothetical protein
MKNHVQNLFIALAIFAGIHQAGAQGTTAFTYQGQLRDGGTNANGAYTMIFKLYDAVTSGNQIGAAITNSPTLFNGLFSVNLDFGAGAFNGSARWLDITVSNGVAQTLSPRVQVLPSPYAQFAAVAATVTNGAIMRAQLAVNAVNANNIASGQVVKSLDGLADAVSITAGTNVILTTNGNTLQISATSGGGGGVVVTNKLAAGNNVGLFTNSGIVQISSFVPTNQFFRNVTNATFTVPTNVTRIMIEMWGAGGGGGNGSGSFSGGGGGAGAYAMNNFAVIPGSSYLVTAGGSTVAGQSGATSSFGALMTAGGGSAGGNATAGGDGAGGAAGTSTGAPFQVADGGQSGAQGGQGGGVWRGSPGSMPGGGGHAVSGPGGGGGGGGPGSPGGGGNSGLVIVYY